MSSGHSTEPKGASAPSLLAQLESLEASERRFRALVEQFPGAVTLHAADGALLYASPNFSQMLGQGPLALFGPEPGPVIEPAVHPEDGPALRRLFAGLLERPGDPVLNCFFRYRHPAGAWLWIEAAGRNLLASPAIGAIVFYWRDVPERNITEEERVVLERKRQEEQRVESLGVLAGGIAHNFNNLLTTILGFGSLAQNDLHASSPVQAYLQQIERAAHRAADLCRQMLAYAGKGHFRLTPVSLSATVRDAADLLPGLVSGTATLQYQLAEGLPPILADADQLRQVLLALVTNASEALDDRAGPITIVTETARLETGGRRLVLMPACPEAECAVLMVRDTGCGMDEATQARIFEPFFTTKFMGRGLGLAAVLGMVRSHGGGVEVASAPGQGSTFRLFFPFAPA